MEQRAPLINEVFSPKCFVCLALPASTFSFSGLCFPLPQTELRKKKKRSKVLRNSSKFSLLSDALLRAEEARLPPVWPSVTPSVCKLLWNG